MQILLNVLLQTIKSRWAGITSRIKLFTSWNFIRTRIISRIRDFFYNMFNMKPRNKDDYHTIFGWMISKRLVNAIIVVIGVISLYYIVSESSVFSGFRDNGGIKTYKYNSVRLRTVKDRVRITGKSGYLAYEGDVADGYVTGQGTLFGLEGNTVYEGAFENNKYEGSGTLNYPDGSTRYQGSFHNNLFEGDGILYREDGTFEYTGEFSQGMKNGKGTLFDNGENAVYEGSFSSDDIVYSELLGKSAGEVGSFYKGDQVLYQMNDDITVYMKDIDGVYFGSAQDEALDDDLKVEDVYVLRDYFNFGNDSIETITGLSQVMGDPFYEGNSSVIFPEVVCINKLNEKGSALNGRVEVESEAPFDDVINIQSFDSGYIVYIYSFKRGDLIYSFVCNGQSDHFDFYYVSAA